MEALNFYSPVVADQLRHRRKTATIRLGDKSGKYRKGLVVCVLAGQRFGVREKIFDAVVDKVEVKPLREVSPREIQHDNPEMRHIDEFVHFLGQLYNREVTEDDTVTVIHFSEIRAGVVAAGDAIFRRASLARMAATRCHHAACRSPGRSTESGDEHAGPRQITLSGGFSEAKLSRAGSRLLVAVVPDGHRHGHRAGAGLLAAHRAAGAAKR
jgi:hypothetical protein